MIATRQKETIYLIKDLPFSRRILGLFFIVASSGYLFIQIRKWVTGDETLNTVYVVLSLGLFAMGLAILHKATTTVTLINNELKVITIAKKAMFTTSYTQYGFDEIKDEFYVKERGLIGGLLPTSSIHLPLKKESEALRLSGRTCFFSDVISEAVAGANKFLRRNVAAAPESLSELKS